MTGHYLLKNRLKWSGVLSLVLILLIGCAWPAGRSEETAASLCSRPITPEMLGMHLEPAAQLPYLAGEGRAARVERFGMTRARQQAETLLAVPTLCDEPIPEAIAAVLEQAQAALQQGNNAEAVRLIRSLLHGGTGCRPSGLAQPWWQADPDWRARIRATIQFAEELALQGDQQGFDQVMGDVVDYFGEQASQALEQADFREALRIAEEAMLLGRQDVADRALDILRDLVRQEWQQTVAGFNPCLNDPDKLREATRKLMDVLAKAQFFGVPGAVDGEMYTTTVQLFEKARRNFEALSRGEPPNCGYRGAFTLDGATGFAALTGSVRSCGGMSGPWEAQAHLTYDDNDGIGHCEGDLQWTFSLNPDTQRAEGTISVANLACVPPEAGCTYPTVTETLRFKAQAQGESLSLTLGSSGQGHLVIYCPDPEDPQTITGPLALFWGMNEVTVALTPDETCP